MSQHGVRSVQATSTPKKKYTIDYVGTILRMHKHETIREIHWKECKNTPQK